LLSRISALPSTVFYFTAYDTLLHQFRSKFGDVWIAPTLSGTIARSAVVTLASPVEMLRTKLQSELLSFAGLFQQVFIYFMAFTELRKAIRVSIKQDGILSMYRGLTATLWRDIPFSAIYWTCYEQFKKSTLMAMHRERTDFLISFICGMTAGLVASSELITFYSMISV
jgi:solute carrier family 25 protein 39/40